MAIREVKVLPKEAKRDTIKKQIKRDIDEALERGIIRFEFVDDYDFKNLAGYAAEVAKQITRDTVRPTLDKLQEDLGFKYAIPVKLPKGKEEKYLRIISYTGKDRRHVYCEISKDAIETIVKESVEAEARREKRDVK